MMPIRPARLPESVNHGHALWIGRAAVLLLTWLGLIARPSIGAELRSIDGFALPQPGAAFTFPRDHGSHPEFKIEWWYLTGHLQATNVPDGSSRRFGFQATFFRRAAPRTAGTAAQSGGQSPSFGTDHLHLAHMALLDLKQGSFLHEERLNRQGWDAYSATHTLDVRNGNWTLRLTDPATQQMELQGSIRADAKFGLTLAPAKPLVRFGSNGVSQKAAESWAASHYLTFPRLRTQGTVTVGAVPYAVTGEAWMDHEISSSQLGAGQVGWDWACIQFHDGRELMAYRMRRSDGTTDPFSTLAWIDRDGHVVHQSPDSFSFQPAGTWTSPRTRATYPARIRLTALDPSNRRKRAFLLEPWLADQELVGGLGGVAYWEGACRVLDDAGAEIGQAYLEMTGYAGNLRSTME